MDRGLVASVVNVLCEAITNRGRSGSETGVVDGLVLE